MYLIGGVAETIVAGIALFCIIVCCILQVKEIINYNKNKRPDIDKKKRL